jgi:hypothetical protein
MKREAKKKNLKVPNWLKRSCNIKKAWPVHIVPNVERRESDGPALTYDFTKADTIKAQSTKGNMYGMTAMLKSCGLELEGKHHSGIDDAKNIARCAINLMERGFEFT